MRHLSAVLGLVLGLSGCSAPGVHEDFSGRPSDVSAALAALPEVEIVATHEDGLPTFIRGDLGRVVATPTLDEPVLRAALGPALASFRLTATDVKLVRQNTDGAGNHHVRVPRVEFE